MRFFKNGINREKVQQVINGLGKRPLAFLYALIYMPWFMLLEHFVQRYYLLECSLDYVIPFCEYFIIPYLFWFVYSAIVFFYFMFFENDRMYWRLCIAMFGGMTIALFIYTIFPNGIHIRPDIDASKNIFCWMCSVIYSTDTATNVFPSLHTYTSVLFIFFLSKSKLMKKHPWMNVISVLISGSIVASTVLLKQHCVLDLLAGTAMAFGMYHITFAREEEEQAILEDRNGYEWNVELKERALSLFETGKKEFLDLAARRKAEREYRKHRKMWEN